MQGRESSRPFLPPLTPKKRQQAWISRTAKSPDAASGVRSLLFRAFHDANVVEIAILLGVVEAVADYKLVGNLKSNVACVDGTQAALGFIE